MTASILSSNTLAQFNGVQRIPAGVFFAVDGTVYPGAPGPPYPLNNDGAGQWCGFSSGIAGGLMNAQDGLWDYVGVGYPAITVPMWPSVQIGRHNLITAIRNYATNYYLTHGNSYKGLVITMSGYSQGAMVTDQVWVLDILNPAGTLNYLLPYVWRMFNFGDIFRTPGIAYGNQLAGLPQSITTDGVETGGIGGPLDLTVAQTNYPAPDGQPVVQSSANLGDIYTCCPVGTNPWTAMSPAGKTGNLFFKIIMQPTFVDVISSVKVLQQPLGSVEEMINGLKFAALGTNAPHWHYFTQMDAVINAMLILGNSLPHSGC